MYKGTNPSAKRSQQWIANALVFLMQEKSLEEITVKEITEKCDLARQTFYQVFDSKEEVLDYIMDTLLTEYLGQCKTQVIDNLCDAAKLFFQFFSKNEPFIEALASNQKICILQKKCKEYLQDENFLKFTRAGILSSQEKDFASAFVTSGLVGMLVIWLKSGKTLGTDELADIVCRLTSTPSDMRGEI